jgi:type 1 glutamine amidotransferase
MLQQLLLSFAVLAALTAPAAPFKALIIDGQNNHDWKSTTPHLRKILEETGLFTVEVATTPAAGKDISDFKPRFADYAVLISNYNGVPWAKETEDAFVQYVRNGGGFVSVHAADNAFPDWKEYNEMIGVGGWGGRSEKSGVWLYWADGWVRDTSRGPGGSHGAQHAFKVTTRAPEHPIMAGLPAEWMHAKDELYDRLRGPATNVTVLATAWSDPATRGTGHHEPSLMAISYGKGRIFHTALGHNNGKDIAAQRCVGFIVTLQRGTEWAASGRVTQKVPANFPTADEVKLRE